MRIAIIDLGTNTFNLIIADITNNQPEIIFRTKLQVKLGEGGISNNLIAPTPFQRGINALKKHSSTIKKYHCDKILAFATSAIRSADNGRDFIKTALNETGIQIRMIIGSHEAELIYQGVRHAIDLGETPKLIVDIGGGSTEFIIGNKNEIFWKKSFLLGASRLMEAFHPSDPITSEEIEVIENYLENKLKPAFMMIKKHNVSTLIGSSGSFSSFADMIMHQKGTPLQLKGKKSYQFNIQEVLSFHHQLMTSTYQERLKIKGLIPMRADMIVIASILVKFIIIKMNIKEMYWSKYSLKEGVVFSLSDNNFNLDEI